MNIMLTSSGRRGYMVDYFKKVLKGKGIVYVGNCDANVASFAHADRNVVTPVIFDDDYIEFLLEFCLKNDITVIIPLFDIDLYILSRNKSLFKSKGIDIIVSESAVIDVCNDKWKMKCFLEEKRIQTPETFLTIETAVNAIRENRMSFPLLIKPRWGMGSIGIYEVNNLEELKVLYLKSKQQVKESYLKYESKENYELSVLIQEKIPGQEYGIDIINNLDGEYQNTVVKKKYSMRAGETDIAVTVKNEMIESLGEYISEELKHIGNLDMDVILSDENRIYVIDLNARFGGGYPFSHCAGVNLPEAIITWIRGEEVQKELLTPTLNVKGYKDISVIC